MTRSHLLLAVLALLAMLGLWLLLGADPPPRFVEEPTARDQVGPTAAQEVEAEIHREAMATDIPDSASAPRTRRPGVEPVATGNLRGVVKELGDAVVPDVTLELVDSAGLVIGSTTTDEGGRFAFDQSAPQGASLIAQLASGAGPRTRHSRLRQWAGAEVVIWIPPPATIAGIVIDSAGQPVEGAFVQTDRPTFLLNMSPWEVLEGPEIDMASFARTDAAGHFTLSSTQRGVHHLRASHDGLDASVKCQAGDQAIVLRLGTHLGGMVAIEGRLHDRGSGAPIVGAMVSVQFVRVWPHGSSSVGVASAVTDELGHYEVLGLDVGKFILSTLPDGYAPSSTFIRDFEDGHHTVDFVLDPARELLVHVVMPDGSPPSKAEIHVLDAAGRRVKMRRLLRMLTDALPVDQDGQARLRLLPAAPLTLLAVRGDLFPAGRLEVDLTAESPELVTIMFPSDHPSFARTHYFKLLGPDGKPASIEGTVLAESFDGDALLSRVEGRWRGEKFVFGHDQRSDFNTPTIAVGALKGACRVEITAPGYAKSTLTLEPGAKSPTSVRLER